MMSLTIIKEEIERFLKTSDPEVLAIRGEWGVGKTFTWKKILKEKKSSVAPKTKYSYVSLFGINNISALESAIFRSMINQSHIDEEPNIETFKQNISDLFSGIDRGLVAQLFYNGCQWIKGKLGYVKAIPKIGSFFGLIDTICFLAVKDAVICIDDFERKGINLDLRDVLGLVSMLKEQRNCKVVLIFNDNELKNEAEEYNKFREKVIDIELVFDLNSEDCLNLVFCEQDETSNTLRKFSKILEINNIRILKKIKRLSAQLVSKLSKYPPEVTNQALRSLVLYSWCFYSKVEKVPSFDFVKNIGKKMVFSDNEGDKQDKSQETWKSILRKYDYLTTDDFDLVIASGVEHGYFSDATLKSEAEKLNDQIISGKSEKAFFNAWKIFHGSFRNNPGVCK